jgi:Zn-finger nucleic acid-binding protein
MKCPACNHQLKMKSVGGVQLDVCESGCAGIWFDQYELKRFDEKHEAPEGFLQSLEASKKIDVKPDVQRNCPKCETIPMMRHFYSAQRTVQVDQCPNCAGFWLDCGELTKIHILFPRDEDRISTNERFIAEMLGEDLSKMKAFFNLFR